MAKQPTSENLGSLLRMPGSRPTARNDVSAYGGGAQKVAAAGERFGATVAGLGSAAVEAARRRQLAEATNARAYIYGRLLGARARYAADPDYGTLPQRWSADADKIVEDGLAGVSNDNLRTAVRRDVAAPLAQERAAVETQAFRGAAAAHAQARESYLRALVQNITADPHDAVVTGGIDAYHAAIDNALDRGFITREQALAEKRRGALALCEGEYAAMARRDPERAVSELQGQADGHPLLVHLPPERKDALIRQAQQRQAANGIDTELNDARRQQRERGASDDAETALAKDLLGDNPSVTGNDILDNGALSAAARQRLLGAVSRRLEPEPPPALSNGSALDLLDRIRRPDGDAEKIADIPPLVEAYGRGDLSRADFGLAARQLADAATPEGAILARHRQAFMTSMAALADRRIAEPLHRDAIGQGGAAVMPGAQGGAAIEPFAKDRIAADAIVQNRAGAEADGRESLPDELVADAPVPADSVQETMGADDGTPEIDADEEAVSGDEAAAAVNAGDAPGDGVTGDGQQETMPAGQPRGPAMPSSDAASRAWLYGLERDLDYRIDRYRRDGKDPLDLFDPSKLDYVGKAATLSPSTSGLPLPGLLQLVQNPGSSAAPPAPPAPAPPALLGPPLPVILPNGSRVKNPFTGTDMMSPVDDLRPVAAAGRETGQSFRDLLSGGQMTPALSYLYLQLHRYVGQGGLFDYQRTKQGSTYYNIEEFRPAANFNVGLFCQQAGFSLDETLRISGLYAYFNSKNTNPSNPYGLDDKTLSFITQGFNAGASGVFSPQTVP